MSYFGENTVRGGTRGGAGRFSWEDVAADKDRENYLGHSISAPVGRWQKNRDITWYNKEKTDGEADELRKEMARIKEKEAEALQAALGVTVPGLVGKPGDKTPANEESSMKKKEKHRGRKELADKRDKHKKERNRSRERQRDRSSKKHSRHLDRERRSASPYRRSGRIE